MGLKLERTLRNLDYLTDPARRRRIARKITFRMTRLADTSLREQDEFLAFCRRHEVRPFIVGLFNYKGDVHSELPVPPYACEHISRLDILASGQVTLCCMDQDGEYAWGDVTNQSVLEVWRGQVARRYREMHRTGRRRQIDPCGSCNLFWPDYRELDPLQRGRAALQFAYYYLRHRPIGRKAPAKASAGEAAPSEQTPSEQTE
jgi:radical SAM protein with 4Fe4S-binding SPASM domain